MNWFDYSLIVVIGLSVLFAALRGFLREVISLLSWVVAFTAATQLNTLAAPLLSPYISNAGVAGVVAFIGVFVITLLLMWGVGHLLKLMASSAGLSWLDRLLGMFFGLARGILIILVGFMALLSFNVDPPRMVSQSYLSPHFVEGARQLSRVLPESSALLERIKRGYNQAQERIAGAAGSVSGAAGVMEQLRQLTPRGGARPAGGGGSNGGAAPAGPTERDVQELEQLMRDLNSQSAR